MAKPKNKSGEQAPLDQPNSSWTEGDISVRKGSTNLLLIAPHGHLEDDEKTCAITRLVADKIDAYAFVNETYQKPPFKVNQDLAPCKDQSGREDRYNIDPQKKWINLNRKDQVQKYLKSEFEEPLLNTVNEIIKKYGKALVLWIHGIDDKNLTPDNTEGYVEGMDALIGIGQGATDRFTAGKNTVDILIDALQSNSEKLINVALARKGSDYCGRHENNLNQLFIEKYGFDQVESIQLEIRETGFREDDNYKDTARALADALKRMKTTQPFAETENPILDSAVQKSLIEYINAGEIDLENAQFMSRLNEINSDTIEFSRLVQSIKKNGVLNNIIVRKRSNGNGKPYQLISGYRRMTALKASCNGSGDFENITLPARVLDASLSDDEAYQISFTENLARQDLSLWEIATACAKIKEKKLQENMSAGDIEEYLARLIQKDTRTVRRYLKVATIENKEIQDAVHSGNISYLDALEIIGSNLDENDIATLLNHLKAHPKATRSFKQFYDNIEYCCDMANKQVADILKCKNADGFLSLNKEELKNRIEKFQKISGKKYDEILQGKAGSLVMETSAIEAGQSKKQYYEQFKKANEDLVKNMNNAIKESKIKGQFKIMPVKNSDNKQVTVNITAPINQIWQAIEAVSKIKTKSKPHSQKNESNARYERIIYR